MESRKARDGELGVRGHLGLGGGIPGTGLPCHLPTAAPWDLVPPCLLMERTWGCQRIVMTTQGLCLPRRGTEPGHSAGDPTTPSIFAGAQPLGWGQQVSRWSWAWARVELACGPRQSLDTQPWPPLWTLAPLSRDSCHLGMRLTLFLIPSILEAMCLGHSESGNTPDLSPLVIFPTP